MNIIYVLTLLILITVFILKNKKEEKENILKWLAISIIMVLCYNIFVCAILYFLQIKSDLISLSIINIIIIIIFGIKIYKDKHIQKYYINKFDIIAILIILITIIIISISLYKIPMNIKNSITDSAVHYFVSKDFYNRSSLLVNNNSDVLNIWDLDFLMPGAYINTGIVFKIFSGLVSETYFCIIYQIFNIFIWFLSGILMYFLLSKNTHKNKEKVLPLIFSILYMLAYPLNSMISGFAYLSLALNMIITILIVMREDIKYYYKIILMFLLNFGVMFSYYFFAPVVYLAIFLQIIIEIIKNKEKLFSIKNILNITLTLIIPGIFGVVFFIVFQIFILGSESIVSNITAINLVGGIYQNLVTNLLIYILVAIFYIIIAIKNKKNEIQNKMFILSSIFTFILFIGNKLQVVSDYYFYKSYYMLWILVICVAFYGIETLLQKSKKTKILIFTGTAIYCVGLIVSIILNKNLMFFDIYINNIEQIKKDYTVVSANELKILDYYNKNININKIDNKTYICTPDFGYAKTIWIYGITGNPYLYIDCIYVDGVTDNIEQFIISEKKYMLLLKQDYEGNYEEVEQDIQKYNLKILYKNPDGMILEKN